MFSFRTSSAIFVSLSAVSNIGLVEGLTEKGQSGAQRSHEESSLLLIASVLDSRHRRQAKINCFTERLYFAPSKGTKYEVASAFQTRVIVSVAFSHPI
jgi:hypothetical protein